MAYSSSDALRQSKIAAARGVESPDQERPRRGEEGVEGDRPPGLSNNQQTMPGVLRSERDGRQDVKPSQGFPIKSAVMAHHDTANRTDDGNQERNSSTINGSLEEVNRYQTNGNLSATEQSQASLSAFLDDSLRQLPPEIAHITMGYLSLSDLITRLVQETFNGMNVVINEMSEVEIPQSNGSTPVNPAQGNVQKKLRLLEFTQDRRAKFIKILVLSQWSRRAESISKVIDLKAWLDAQSLQYDSACSWIGELKRIMALERMPNPDLKTALEALSLGKAPGLPDLGYVRPKQVPPQQLLTALRSINTQLTIRLRLHETIPAPLKNYSISNGRATFRVPNEFEVDLSIADEDPSTQLYFIDFRFLYSPTPAEIRPGRLRDDLEAKVNILLGHDGLEACYQFLHDFVLCHKLGIFRHQVHRLSQAGWSEHLKVEAVHRSLVIQYWVTRPGAKSWIELGIRRRNVKKSSWLHEEEDGPHIGIRWFCAGKEVTNVPLIIDLGDLSVEGILKQIIAAHTNAIFRETRAKLREGHLYSKKTLRLKHHRSTIEPAACNLSVQLTPSQSCTIIQEPVSGRLVLLPPSSLYSRTEREINNLVSPEKTAFACIATLRAAASCEEVERVLRCYGWTTVNSLRPNQDKVRHHFGRDTLRASFFRKKTWDAKWLLAFTASLAGDSWWIVELNRSSRVDPTAAPGPSIRAAFKVPSSADGVALKELSYPELSQIEVTAAGMISQHTDSRQLALQRIPHRLVKTSSSRTPSTFATLYVYLPESRVQPAPKNQEFTKMPRLSQVVKLSFIGVDESTSYANHLVIAQSSCATLRSQPLDSTDGECVTFHPTSGAFAFRLRNAVGTSAIPGLLDCLAKIQRLVEYVTTVQASKIHKFSLRHIEFTYATGPPDLRAKVTFIDESPPRISFGNGNPHLRIQNQLTVLLGGREGLKHVILLLSMTLPLMRALAAIETLHGGDEVTIMSRSAEWYQLRYEHYRGKFDLRLRRRREEFLWFVEEVSSSDGKKPQSRAHEEFRNLVNENGEGWSGMSPGIVASVSGVEALLRKINDIFQNPPAIDPAPIAEVQDYKAQKRKREDDDVVVLD
ncbi:MAG: hypothetical protein Q9178_003051 [Gyalolechia marmorata]